MRKTSRNIAGILGLVASIVAVAVAVSLPASYFFSSYQYQRAAVETEAKINAHLVGEIIHANPIMWRYEVERLSEILDREVAEPIELTLEEQSEIRRILDNRNEVLAEVADELAAPLLTRSAALTDAGKVVGRMEISRSMRPLLVNTSLVAVIGVVLGVLVFIIVQVLTLPALRRALESLSNEKERLSVTLGSIGDGVITTDTGGTILLINKVAQKLTGFSAGEAVGKKLGEVFRTIEESSEEKIRDPVREVTRTGQTTELYQNTVLLARDGTKKLVADSASPIRDKDSEIIGMVLVFRDITEKHRMQEELIRSQKLESLGVLAGGIAHDFNNLLTAIYGNVSLARIKIQSDIGARECLEKAENAAERAKGLTQQLLAFSRGGAPVRQAVSLKDLIQDSADFILSGSNVKCEYDFDDPLWPVEVDPGQFSQVIQNLVINADQAMPDGGLIKIRVKRATAGADAPRFKTGQKYVSISVRDSGVGIPREHLTKIFDPYYTTKKKGSGLGLAISYAIIKNHGGLIEVESESGVGTTIHLHIPSTGVVGTHRKKKVQGPLPGRGRVLIMDDEEIILDAAAGILENLGYDAEMARDGQEMVDHYRKARETGRPFDVIIADLTVPGGMGGLEAMKKLLEYDPLVKIIVSSGYSTDPIMANYEKYGFKGVLVKPYNVDILSRVLHEVIHSA